jgi:hypothetical protein
MDDGMEKQEMSWNNIMFFDKNKGEGVDIDYIDNPDGTINILYVDILREGDVNV